MCAVAQVLQRHRDLWLRAVHHPFLDAVRDGSLPDGAFDTWLGQDRLFVEELLWFQARLLARAERSARSVLAHGALGLVDELEWFDAAIERRDGPSAPDPLQATRRATQLLHRLDEAPARTALGGLWAIERAYLDAWSYAAPGAPAFREYVDRWTTPAFADYVAGLETLVDADDPADDPDVDRVVADVAVMEREFWDMAWRRRR